MSQLQVRFLGDIDPSSPLGRTWESLTQSTAASGFMQSLHWAALKRKQGISSIHLGVFAEQTLIGGAIFYTSAKGNGAGIVVAPEGPVLPWENQSLTAEALRLIIEAVQSRACQLGVMSMRIEPRLTPPVMPALREFGRGPVDLVPRDTLYIDLTMPESDLLASMKPKGRYNIKLAERSGVQVVEDHTADCVKRFYSVMSAASSRDQFAVEPRQFFEHLAGVLLPSKNAKIFFAEEGGDTLGTLLLITYGKRATYLYGGITNKKRNLMGGYALQWAAIKAAREVGCTVYDFYGYDPFRSPGHRYARFSQFKSQFGGTVIRFIGAQDYFYIDNVVDAFVKVVGEAENSSKEKLSRVHSYA
jgi:peptidoglycan pentaglycine glycine transferase (the first glycine)